MSATDTASATLAVCGLGLAFSAARDLRAAPEYIGNGILSWSVASLSTPHTARLSRFMRWDRYRLVLIAQLCAGIAAPGAAFTARPVGAVLACVLATTILITLYRSPYGLDGADQMAAFAAVTAALVLLVGDGPAARVLLHVLTAQVTLSYFIAGMAKLVSPVWRDGTCLSLILSTGSYHAPRLAALLHRLPALGKAMAWSVMLFEVAFFALILLPGTGLWCVLAMGIAFHVGVAVTMGLTTFVFAFAATYPAVVFTVTAFG
ncbi:hypothetical protein [Streptomyces melanogenes]|uniref:hypothetical protein n=1 Tax=Streptomyces melanogenes TaxID=67326 RepID=UPI0037A82A0C